MSQHVRKSYGNNRKATWGLALALVAAIAAVVIPIASGAPDKTYTLLFPAAGAVTANPPTTGNSQTVHNLCADASYTSVQLQLKNTAKTVSLGSANVTFPTNVTLSGSPAFVSGAPSAATISRDGNLVRLRALSLAKNGVVTFSVSLATTGSASLGPKAVEAAVKQSNDFNDTSGDANTFSDPAFPNINVVGCGAPISGKVYLDRDGSGSFATVPTSSTSDQPKQGWLATLFLKTGPTTYTQVGSPVATDANGDYSFTGQMGSDYKVCVTASTADGGAAWGLREPAGNTACGPISATSAATSAGRLIASLGALGANGQNFGVVPVTGPFGADDNTTTTDGNYSVTAGSTTTKPDDLYVQETWTDEGKAYFTFYPVTPCTTGCGQINLLEVLEGQVDQSALNGKQARLMYDDDAPFTDFTTEMPYCKNDPRPPGWADDGSGSTAISTTDILPSGATSCIVVGKQEIVGGAVPKVDFYYLVFTGFDGGRGIE